MGGGVLDSVGAVLSDGESQLMLSSFNLLTISLVSHHHGTAFPEGNYDHSCEGQTGALMDSVGVVQG